VPDIFFGYNPRLVEGGMFPGDLTGEQLREMIKPVAAKQLSCKDERNQPIVLKEHQINFIGFSPLPDNGEKMVVVQIFGYDWPDLLRNIDERLGGIGKHVRRLLRLPEQTVDLSFIKIHRGSANEGRGWIND
jgi:hypothetical protein